LGGAAFANGVRNIRFAHVWNEDSYDALVFGSMKPHCTGAAFAVHERAFGVHECQKGGVWFAQQLAHQMRNPLRSGSLIAISANMGILK
jgi:hypothetical protein